MSVHISLTLTCAIHQFITGAKDPRMIKLTGHVSCTGRKEINTFLAQILKETDRLEDLFVDGPIILKSY